MNLVQIVESIIKGENKDVAAVGQRVREASLRKETSETKRVRNILMQKLSKLKRY